MITAVPLNFATSESDTEGRGQEDCVGQEECIKFDSFKSSVFKFINEESELWVTNLLPECLRQANRNVVK